MSRVYNFSAGPAVLPEEVLKEAAAEMLDYRGTGMSVMEMSHRSKAFQTIIQEAEQLLPGTAVICRKVDTFATYPVPLFNDQGRYNVLPGYC